MSFANFIDGAIKTLSAFNCGQTIGQWCRMEEAESLESISRLVHGNSQDIVDQFDCTFVNAMQLAIDPSLRVQMMKLYAWFKIQECARFGKWRGFPPSQ